MRRFGVWALIAVAAVTMGADSAISDKERLQGEWVYVSREFDGKSDMVAADELVRFEKDKIVMIHKNDPCTNCEFELTLDADEDPKEVDFKYVGTEKLEDAEPDDYIMRGIYRFDNDQLVICMGVGGQARPAEFKTTKGQKAYLLVLKRAQ